MSRRKKKIDPENKPPSEKKTAMSLLLPKIEKYGYAVLSFGDASGDDDNKDAITCAFSYTVGLSLYQHPDLVILGLSPLVAQSILNDLVFCNQLAPSPDKLNKATETKNRPLEDGMLLEGLVKVRIPALVFSTLVVVG